jgi:DNA-binding response OmpR family regulator
MKVLVIEDDRRLADPIVECLTANGLEVKSAVDSLIGIQIAHRFQPDLILLDLMLPAGGGMAVLESIRDSPTIQNTPFIVMTGSHDDALKQQLLKFGIKSYLQKPFDLQTLLAAIAKVIASS